MKAMYKCCVGWFNSPKNYYLAFLKPQMYFYVDLQFHEKGNRFKLNSIAAAIKKLLRTSKDTLFLSSFNEWDIKKQHLCSILI